MSAWVVRRENSAGGVQATRAAPRRSTRHALRPRPDNLPGRRPNMRRSSGPRPPGPGPGPPDPVPRPPGPIPGHPDPVPGAHVPEPPGVLASVRTAPARVLSRRLRHIPSHLRRATFLQCSRFSHAGGLCADTLRQLRLRARATTAAHAAWISGRRGRRPRPMRPGSAASAGDDRGPCGPWIGHAGGSAACTGNHSRPFIQ